MTPLKTSALIFLILGVFCQGIAAFYPFHSKECCHSYTTNLPVPVRKIVRYFKTPSDCSLEAVVFVMKKGKTVCANPSKQWVKKTIAVLTKPN